LKDVGSSNQIAVHTCAGFDWDRVNFFHINLCRTTCWICAENSVDNTRMF